MRKGGAFLAQGSDTCVYDPPLECKDPSLNPTNPEAYVSRVVDDAKDIRKQDMVRKVVDELEKEYPGQIRKYFNFYKSACDRFVMKPTDVNRNDGKVCEKDDLGEPGTIEITYVNIITPKQGKDVVANKKLTKPKEITIPKLFELMKMLIKVDGRFIHLDLHFGNIAWIGDEIVIHDFGRALLPNEMYHEMNTYVTNQPNFDYIKPFPQYYYAVRQAQHTYERSPKFYKNYFIPQLTKVFDILSIIRGMAVYELIPMVTANSFANDISDLLFSEPPKTAMEIIDHYEGFFRYQPKMAMYNDDDYMDMSGGGKGKRPANKLCRCIKHVKSTGKTESSAIAICVRSVIPKGRTLRKFTCKRKATLSTQRRLTRRRK